MPSEQPEAAAYGGCIFSWKRFVWGLTSETPTRLRDSPTKGRPKGREKLSRRDHMVRVIILIAEDNRS